MPSPLRCPGAHSRATWSGPRTPWRGSTSACATIRSRRAGRSGLTSRRAALIQLRAKPLERVIAVGDSLHFKAIAFRLEFLTFHKFVAELADFQRELLRIIGTLPQRELHLIDNRDLILCQILVRAPGNVSLFGVPKRPATDAPV